MVVGLESVFFHSLDRVQYWEAGHPPPPRRRVLFKSSQRVSVAILKGKLAVSSGEQPSNPPPGGLPRGSGAPKTAGEASHGAPGSQFL